MPTVLRVDGFRVVIYAPPREHPPPHVHVFGDGGEVEVGIPVAGGDPPVRRAVGVRDAVAWKACRLVAQHSEFLFSMWRQLHDARFR